MFNQIHSLFAFASYLWSGSVLIHVVLPLDNNSGLWLRGSVSCGCIWLLRCQRNNGLKGTLLTNPPLYLSSTLLILLLSSYLPSAVTQDSISWIRRSSVHASQNLKRKCFQRNRLSCATSRIGLWTIDWTWKWPILICWETILWQRSNWSHALPTVICCSSVSSIQFWSNPPFSPREIDHQPGPLHNWDKPEFSPLDDVHWKDHSEVSSGVRGWNPEMSFTGRLAGGVSAHQKQNWSLLVADQPAARFRVTTGRDNVHLLRCDQGHCLLSSTLKAQVAVEINNRIIYLPIEEKKKKQKNQFIHFIQISIHSCTWLLAQEELNVHRSRKHVLQLVDS